MEQDQITTEIHQINERLDTMDSRLNTMDARLDAMDSRLGTMDGRLMKVEHAIVSLAEKQTWLLAVCLTSMGIFAAAAVTLAIKI